MSMRSTLWAGMIVMAASTAMAQDALPYPDVADVSHAEPETATFFKKHYTLKSRKQLDEALATFSPDLATFTDAALGWPLNGFAGIQKSWTEYMPKWGKGLSYPTRILGGTTAGVGSAVVFATATPELFGGEIRSVVAVDFKAGKIVRWVAYWDSSDFSQALYDQLRTPEDKFPTDFKESQVGISASKAMRDVATKMQAALGSGDAAAATSLMTYDAILEDVALRTQVVGRSSIDRYLKRSVAALPYGTGSRLRHIVGSGLGGGFEWISPTATKNGIAALELNGEGKVTRMTIAYDARPLGKPTADRLRLSVADN